MKYLATCCSIAAVSGICMIPVCSKADLVFSDNFGSSTMDLTPTAPTSTSTSYENFSQGANPVSTVAAGDLHLATRATSSVFGEIAAAFTTSPVTLTSIGDSIDLNIVFIASTNVLSSADNTSAQLAVGLYNSSSTALLQGTRLDAGAAATGGANGYKGYIGRIFANGNGNLITRPVQTGAGALSSDQDLLFNNAGSGAFNSPTATQIGTTVTGFTTTVAQFTTNTLDFSITLSALNTLTISNALYSGSLVNPGNLLFLDTSATTLATFLTNSFDSFAFGIRHTGPSTAPGTLDVLGITVTGPVVPEPTTFALSVLGGFSLLALRRKRRA